ncbi:MAG: hypothetical protein Q8908_02060 [Bacteroidota bacterium]|nr:hypothetical protein [Bacteroidota bacterium]
MKRTFQMLCVVILFSVIYSGCRKEPGPGKQVYSPYAEVINPPDSFYYYVPLAYNIPLQGKIQFKDDAVWRISKTSTLNTNTWISRNDKNSVFEIAYDDTVALQGNIPYYFSAVNSISPEGMKVYYKFTKLNKDYQSFSPKF